MKVRCYMEVIMAIAPLGGRNPYIDIQKSLASLSQSVQPAAPVTARSVTQAYRAQVPAGTESQPQQSSTDAVRTAIPIQSQTKPVGPSEVKRESRVEEVEVEESDPFAPPPRPDRKKVETLAARYLAVMGGPKRGQSQEEAISSLADFYGASDERFQRFGQFVSEMEQGADSAGTGSVAQA